VRLGRFDDLLRHYERTDRVTVVARQAAGTYALLGDRVIQGYRRLEHMAPLPRPACARGGSGTRRRSHGSS
jgi:hypothetical protein